MEERAVLVLERTFNAPIERVFEAWTNAEVMANWFGPEGFSVSRSEVNLFVGGKYHLEICAPDGNKISHYGEYVEISEPYKLAFTWMLADQSCKGSEGITAQTLVSIEFKRSEQTTLLTLTHEQLPSKEAYDGHQFGWTSSLNALETYLK